MIDAATLANDGVLEYIDVWQEHYGLVDVAVSGTRLTLNGEPIFIKGVNWHVDDPEVGAAYRLEHFQRDFDLMGSAGANFVRFSHYPRHPEAYRLTDQLGLMVMDEAPNYWMDRLSFQYQLEDGLSLTYVQSMVWNHMNHPSVILWSILNESETGVRGGLAARSFIERAGRGRAEARPFRPAGDLRLQPPPGRHRAQLCGRHRHQRVLRLFLRRAHDLGPYLDFLHRRYPDKPILITEFGDWAVYGSSRQTTQGLTFLAHWEQIFACSIRRRRHLVGVC